jgi:hypothetical protein
MSDQFSLARSPKNYGSVDDLSAMTAGRVASGPFVLRDVFNFRQVKS